MPALVPSSQLREQLICRNVDSVTVVLSRCVVKLANANVVI